MDTVVRIRQILAARGWTEYRLSKESGLSISTVQNIITRGAHPTLPTLKAICNALGITLSQFFAESEMVELSADLKELFDQWLFLTPEQKEATIRMVRAFNQK